MIELGLRVIFGHGFFIGVVAYFTDINYYVANQILLYNRVVNYFCALLIDRRYS